MRLKRLSLVMALVFFCGVNSAQAQDLPGGLASALPGGLASALPGGLASALPGGLASALPGGAQTPTSPSGATTGSPMTITEEQIALLPADQQQAVREALEKAKAATGAAPSTESAPSMPAGGSIADMFKNLTSILEKLTPEQKKMVDEAQKSGKLPEGFTDMLLAGTLNPAVLSQLSPEQLTALQAVRDSGELTEENLKAIVGQVDLSTVKEIATAIQDKKPIDVEKIKEVAKRVATITCTKGKKTIKVPTKKCPAGFKKKA